MPTGREVTRFRGVWHFTPMLGAGSASAGPQRRENVLLRLGRSLSPFKKRIPKNRQNKESSAFTGALGRAGLVTPPRKRGGTDAAAAAPAGGDRPQHANGADRSLRANGKASTPTPDRARPAPPPALQSPPDLCSQLARWLNCTPASPYASRSSIERAGATAELREIFLSARVPLIKLSPGEVLIRQGEPSTMMYLLLSGNLVLSRTEGARTRSLGTLREGAVLGELSFLLGSTPNVTVSARKARRSQTAAGRSLSRARGGARQGGNGADKPAEGGANEREDSSLAVARAHEARAARAAAEEKEEEETVVGALGHADASAMLRDSPRLSERFFRTLAANLATRTVDTAAALATDDDKEEDHADVLRLDHVSAREAHRLARAFEVCGHGGMRHAARSHADTRPRCHAATRPRGHAATRPHCRAATLPRCHTATLPRCRAVRLC